MHRLNTPTYAKHTETLNINTCAPYAHTYIKYAECSVSDERKEVKFSLIPHWPDFYFPEKTLTLSWSRPLQGTDAHF